LNFFSRSPETGKFWDFRKKKPSARLPLFSTGFLLAAQVGMTVRAAAVDAHLLATAFGGRRQEGSQHAGHENERDQASPHEFSQGAVHANS
jgi:hypothetical protein